MSTSLAAVATASASVVSRSGTISSAPRPGNRSSAARSRPAATTGDREPGMLELARHLELEKSSLSGLVDRAESRGLVERIPSGRRPARRQHPRDAGRAQAVAHRRAGGDCRGREAGGRSFEVQPRSARHPRSARRPRGEIKRLDRPARLVLRRTCWCAQSSTSPCRGHPRGCVDGGSWSSRPRTFSSGPSRLGSATCLATKVLRGRLAARRRRHRVARNLPLLDTRACGTWRAPAGRGAFCSGDHDGGVLVRRCIRRW
jgi:MarR family